MRTVIAGAIIAACGLIACGSAKADPVVPVTGNDTGGIIAYALVGQTDVRAIAVNHCARYGKVVKLTGVQPYYGGYLSFRLHLGSPGTAAIARHVLIPFMGGISLRTFLIPLLGVTALGAAASATAQTVELPTRKAGLWELKMAVAGSQMPSMAIQQCTDETVDKQMSTMFGPMQKNMCSKRDVQKTDNGYVIDSVCSTAGISTTSHAEINGDLNTGYMMKVTSQTGGGPSGAVRNTDVTVNARWAGPCAAGQRPGDIIMPGGMKINVKDIENMQGMMKKPEPASK